MGISTDFYKEGVAMDEVVVRMGKRIAQIRRDLGLTQGQVAEQAGLTTQTVSSAERGTKALRPKNIVKLCQVLKVTPNDLLLESNPELSEKTSPSPFSDLSPQMRYHLEEMIRIFVEAMTQDS